LKASGTTTILLSFVSRFSQLRGVIHNYLRPHLSLGMTPASFAGVTQNISWNNIAGILEVCAYIP